MSNLAENPRDTPKPPKSGSAAEARSVVTDETLIIFDEKACDALV